MVARLKIGTNVTALDRVPDPGDWPEGVEYRQVDLDREMPAFKGSWILVHLAWSLDRANAAAQQESLQTFARLLGQENLAGVVGLGSAEEYGEREGRLREDQAPGAKLSAYGQAKHAAGKALEAWARGAGRKAVWLRPFVVYGPGQGGNMAIPYALRCARERTPGDFSEGLQFRDFVYMDDVADGIAAAALAWPTLKPAFSVCNLGRGEAVRLRDVLDRMAGNMGVARKFHFGVRPMREGEPAEQYADVLKAEELGWKARIGWQQGIDALCQEALK